MIPAREIVLTRSNGPLTIIAEFAPIEVDTMNSAGRASANLAFRQLAEAYMRSAKIGPFLPKVTDNVPARDIVRQTIQAIASRTKTKDSKAAQRLNPNYLESRLKLLCEVSPKILQMTKTRDILNALKHAGFVDINETNPHRIVASDQLGRRVVMHNRREQEPRILRQIYKDATAVIQAKK